FDVAADLDLRGVTIRNGDARTSCPTPSGGGIFSAPDPPLTTSVNLTLEDVTITGNKANEGGGIDNEYASKLTLSGVTFTQNSALLGGGLQNLATDPAGATLTNVTLTGNTAGSGAGISNEGDLTLTSVTMGGDSWDDGNVGGCTIRDTIFAGSPS